MLQRLITLAVWALLGWTLMLLLLRLLPSPLQTQAPALAPEAPPPASLSRLFGSKPAPAEQPVAALPGNARYRLIGVVAPRSAQLQSERGVALLTIDGGPAKAYRVGDWVDGELRLLAVEPRAVGLGQAGVVQIQLSLSELPAASTGSLPGLPGPAVPMPAIPALPVQQQPTEQREEQPDPAGPRRPPPPSTR